MRHAELGLKYHAALAGGCVACGAAIGGAVGAGAGYLYDQHEKHHGN